MIKLPFLCALVFLVLVRCGDNNVCTDEHTKEIIDHSRDSSAINDAINKQWSCENNSISELVSMIMFKRDFRKYDDGLEIVNSTLKRKLSKLETVSILDKKMELLVGKGKPQEAIELGKNIVKMDSISDHYKFMVMLRMGNIYTDLKDFASALATNAALRDFAYSINDSLKIQTATNNLCVTYLYLNNIEEAKSLNQQFHLELDSLIQTKVNIR